MSVATCIICFVPFSEELEIVSLKCCHCFHRDCIDEWLRMGDTCPQCRTDADPSQMSRVILSFEKGEEKRSEWDSILIESQDSRIMELEQQIKSKDLIIEETLRDNKNVENLRNEIKYKEEIIARTEIEKEKLEKLLMDLTRRLKSKEQILTEFQHKHRTMLIKLERLNTEIQETRRDNQELHKTLNKISLIAFCKEPPPDYDLSNK